ncbi:hypothetical protein LCL98_24870 [Rossellomorea aquimaris]|nr:hypothetical protein [Rossellomorea aquimaris]
MKSMFTTVSFLSIILLFSGITSFLYGLFASAYFTHAGIGFIISSIYIFMFGIFITMIEEVSGRT